MSGRHILVADDDTAVSQLVALYLEREGFAATTAASGTEALELCRGQHFDLAVLDIMLPGLDGLAVCRCMREKSTMPVIFLSCYSDESVKIDALGIGDDYVTKPFSPGELMARVKAHLRRVVSVNKEEGGSGGLEIDFVGKQVVADGHPVLLSATEFRLVALLAANPDRVYSTEQLFELVWQTEGLDDTRTVAVHISNLRKKIEPDPAKPQYIVTKRGFGYQFGSSSA